MLHQFLLPFLFHLLLLPGFCLSYELLSGDHNISIEALQTRLADESINHADAASLWLQLGTLLTFKDMRYHEDGFVTRERALDAFNQALRTAAPEDRHVELVAHHKRGMLLKMMGRGEEAVRAHDQSFALATSDADRSVALQFKAAALSMMGTPSAAAVLFREALSLAPSQLGIYHPLAGCLAEMGQSPEEWRALLEEVRERGRAYDAGELLESFPEQLSFEYSTGTSSPQYHWALFVIADKAGEMKQAWRSLQRAHEIQIKKVGLPPSNFLDIADHTIANYKKGFLLF